MKFQVSIEKQSDGTYIAYNTNVDGLSLIGTGNTVSEAKRDFFNSMNEVAETYDSENDIPECLKVEPEFKFDLASLFEYYSMLNMSAFARFLGINDALMRQYKKGNTYISEAQLQKIENGIHQLGKEFSSLKLV
ncbi:hypothetical protein [uncultured Bacteroides sp.]|uniref:hypothetical protein n=1 Tax=uncultured Bacteroides sp. TaxID=162156 RepID=UPI00261C3528|nr:hypothetical protein [uncultured Bacteroides sp.]